VQVTNVGTILNNRSGQVVASCPAGTFAVGGGVDLKAPMWLVSDGPTAGGQGLDAFRTGPMPAPDGWEAVGWNISPDTPAALTVTAICEPSSGGNIAPVTVVTTVETSAVADRAAGEGAARDYGETDDTTASCPGSDEALSGGVDVDSPVTTDDAFIINSGPASEGTPVSWSAQLAIGANTPSLGYVVGVLCTDPSEGKPGLPALGIPRLYSSDESAAVGIFNLTSPACPTGSEAVGGGAVAPTDDLVLLALTPLQASGARPSATPAGTYPAATQWSAVEENAANSPETVTVSVICVPPPPNAGVGNSRTVTRLAGASRDATAVAVSENLFPSAGIAKAVVLSRDDSFADALAGTPLAVHAHGPLLLTPPAALDPGTQQEIERVLPAGGTVFLLGGTGAISQAVADTLTGLGFNVTRIAGADRFDTAVQIAQQLGNPATVIEATGMNFPDALAAGAAAAAAGDALLLTNDTTQASETAAYLAAHPNDNRIAVGGQAAAADPGATPIVGVDRYDTAAKVATLLFNPAPTTFGAALGTNFPDALAGGARSGFMGEPLLLVTTSAPLPSETADYLSKVNPRSGVLYGGPGAVDDSTLTALETA
jgi:putative cell wall-binding protein